MPSAAVAVAVPFAKAQFALVEVAETVGTGVSPIVVEAKAVQPFISVIVTS